jgi:hypothetical protein
LVIARNRIARPTLRPTFITPSRSCGRTYLKVTELANLCAETLDEPVPAARRGVERVCNDEHPLFSFLKATGLSL